MASDYLENSQLVPDVAAFLDDLLSVEILPPLEEPAASPTELLGYDTKPTARGATALSPDVLSPGMLSIGKSPSPEELLILSTEPITSDSADFPPASKSIPPAEHTDSPSETPVPDATAFLGDLLSIDKATTPDGLLAPSEALSIKRETDESAPKLGKRAGSIVGQGVQVSNLRLFIRFDQASEVSEITRIFRLPGTPKWVCGLSNLHGNLVPVLDIATFLNLPNEAGEKTILLVLGHGEHAVAIPVSGIPERLRFDEEDRIPAPLVGEHLQPYVPGAFTRGNDIWLELEHEKLLKTLAASLAS